MDKEQLKQFIYQQLGVLTKKDQNQQIIKQTLGKIQIILGNDFNEALLILQKHDIFILKRQHQYQVPYETYQINLNDHSKFILINKEDDFCNCEQNMIQNQTKDKTLFCRHILAVRLAISLDQTKVKEISISQEQELLQQMIK